MIDFAAAVARDADALFELCAQEPTRPIPSCPGWTAKDLAQHITDTLKGEETENGRGAAHECAIHRWDAATSFGVDYAIDTELACDGIDEFFDGAWPMLLAHLGRPAGHGEVLLLRCTDADAPRRVVLDDLPQISVGEGPCDVEVSGTASDLVLWLWGRSDPPSISGDRSVLEMIRNPTNRFLSPGF